MKVVAIDSAVRFNYLLCNERPESRAAVLAVSTDLKMMPFKCAGCNEEFVARKRIEYELAIALQSQDSVCIFDGLSSGFYRQLEAIGLTPPICKADIFVIKRPKKIEGCVNFGVYTICYDGDVNNKGVLVDDELLTFGEIVTLNALAHSLANTKIEGLWKKLTRGCIGAKGTHPSLYTKY